MTRRQPSRNENVTFMICDEPVRVNGASPFRQCTDCPSPAAMEQSGGINMLGGRSPSNTTTIAVRRTDIGWGIATMVGGIECICAPSTIGSLSTQTKLTHPPSLANRFTTTSASEKLSQFTRTGHGAAELSQHRRTFCPAVDAILDLDDTRLTTFGG